MERASRPRTLLRPWVLLAAVLAGLLLGGVLAGLRGLVAGPPTSGWPSYEARGRLVEVEGRSVYVDCRGAGTVTVVFEGGLGSGASGWGRVLDDVAGFARACAWDRPGMGRSQGRGTHTIRDTAADLRAALAGAGERPPFVAVGHSLGAVYVRVFAARSSADVAGVLIIDGYEPDLGLESDPTLSPDAREQIRRSLADQAGSIAAVEGLDWARALAELAASRPVAQPEIGLSVDPRSRYTTPDARERAAEIAAWERAVRAIHPNMRLEIVPGAGHFIHLERPELVVARIRELVELAGGSSSAIRARAGRSPLRAPRSARGTADGSG